MHVEDKNSCQLFVFQIFGTVVVPNQWWYTSMVAHIWKGLEIYMMGVSWQVMAMWSSSQSTIDLGYSVRSFLVFFFSIIPWRYDNFVLTCFVLLCFLSVIVLCLLILKQNFFIFSINSINVHILLDKRQLGLVLIFNDKR